MIEMTLFSRNRIRISSPGGLRTSTLPLGHGGSPQYWLLHVDGEETFLVSFKPPRPGTEPRTLALKAAVLTTTLSAPALLKYKTLQCKLYVVILSQQYNNDAETRRWPGAGLMSDHRVRRQPNINPTWGQRLVFSRDIFFKTYSQ